MEKVARLSTCFAVLIGVLATGGKSYGQLDAIYQKEQADRDRLAQKCLRFYENAQFVDESVDWRRFYIDSDPKQSVWEIVQANEKCGIERIGSMLLETIKSTSSVSNINRDDYGQESTEWEQTQFKIIKREKRSVNTQESNLTVRVSITKSA